MVNIKVKWGTQMLDLDVDLSESAETLKLQLESLTGVPSDRQKVMGVKGGMLKDGTNLKAAGIAAGKMLMLIGSAEELPAAASSSAAEVEFSEDRVGGHKSAALACGLRNIGNTCYLNSAIQSIRFVPEVQGLLDRGTSAIERSLAQLYRTLAASPGPVNPIALWAAFCSQYPAFGERDDHGHPMQHDSQEALGNVLTLVNQTIGRSDELRRYANLFEGKLQSKESYTNAPELESTTSERTFNIFPCNITGDVLNIEAGIERSLSESVTSTNQELGREVERTAVSRFEVLPEYFIVQFTRFGWRQDTNSKTKILKPITFPMVLDVGRLCTEELQAKMKDERDVLKVRRDKALEKRKRSRQKTVEVEEVEEDDKPDVIPEVFGNTNGFYELSSVISHKGRDADGGHYVAWCKNKGQWLVLDDDNTAIVTEDDVLNLRGTGEAHIAYVLVYRSRDPDTHNPPLHF